MTAMQASVLVAGVASGPLALLTAPLSFWGGVDIARGIVSDSTHPQHLSVVAGHVLAMPAGRGSSSSSSALLEAVRLGTAPAAIILMRPDPILLVGALASRELYGRGPPVVLLPSASWPLLCQGMQLRIEAHADRAAVLPMTS